MLSHSQLEDGFQAACMVQKYVHNSLVSTNAILGNGVKIKIFLLVYVVLWWNPIVRHWPIRSYAFLKQYQESYLLVCLS